MKQRIKNSGEIYRKQFKLAGKLVGSTIRELVFYLESFNTDLTEQSNNYGKSLLNGIDIRTDDEIFSIGNRFTDVGYGLRIDLGSTAQIEYFQYMKEAKLFSGQVVNEMIDEVKIYWLDIPFQDEEGLYPQEIEVITKNGYLLISSIEVTGGEVSTEFTDELLVIDDIESARILKLGRFGQGENGRVLFKDFNELKEKIGYIK
ncbi:hypothetical protein [Owenweeksia hongkongensis]|uniref:hypothetical protein n=1 Tax=Owenweeksia hongkongensis TaxID=253245 RepID=UPI003A946A4D